MESSSILTQDYGVPLEGVAESVAVFAEACPQTNESGKPDIDVVLGYLRGVAIKRRLPRGVAWKFVDSCRALLVDSERTHPDFLRTLAGDLRARVPARQSWHRKVLYRTISAVLDDLGVDHDRKKVLKTLPDFWDDADPESDLTERRAVVNERARNLRQALAVIDAQAAEMVRLYYLEGWTQEQIGRKFGRPKQRVNEIIKAAVDALPAVMMRLRGSR